MPAIRLLSTLFIEFVRGVPLITVLFMASVMLPLFLPETWSPDKLVRALVGIALFSSAYMAEVVRAGLQSMQKGQYDAAHALGLGYWQSLRYIILPQALKVTIPNIVNSYIARTMDDGFVMDNQHAALVLSQTPPRQLSVKRDQYLRFPNGTPVNFVDPATTLESSLGAVIVAQNPADSNSPQYNGTVDLTLDRDLPVLPPGMAMVYADPLQRGQGSSITDSIWARRLQPRRDGGLTGSRFL